MNAADLVDDLLHLGDIGRELRLSSIPVYDQNVLCIHLGHYLNGMRGHYHLGMAVAEEADKTPLQIGVHVHVGLVEDYGVKHPAPSEEPHCLQPHLKPVAH